MGSKGNVKKTKSRLKRIMCEGRSQCHQHRKGHKKAGFVDLLLSTLDSVTPVRLSPLCVCHSGDEFLCEQPQTAKVSFWHLLDNENKQFEEHAQTLNDNFTRYERLEDENDMRIL